MTPFAQLGLLHKSAGTAAPAGYQYQTNAASGLKDPFSPYTPVPGSEAAKQNQGWTWGDTGWLVADTLAATNPFTGVPYYGAKAINDFAHGRIWSGIGNIGWGAASFLPGIAGVGKGVLSGATRFGAKMTPGFLKAMQTGSKLSPFAAKAIGTGSVALGATGLAGGFLSGEGSAPAAPAPAQSPYNADSIPELMARSMIANKPV